MMKIKLNYANCRNSPVATEYARRVSQILNKY